MARGDYLGDFEQIVLLAVLRLSSNTYVMAERGVSRARRWYWRQTLRSLPALMRSEAASSDWQLSLALIFIAAAGQTVLFDRFWSAMLSFVPLKVDLVRDSTYAAFHL